MSVPSIGISGAGRRRSRVLPPPRTTSATSTRPAIRASRRYRPPTRRCTAAAAISARASTSLPGGARSVQRLSGGAVARSADPVQPDGQPVDAIAEHRQPAGRSAGGLEPDAQQPVLRRKYGVRLAFGPGLAPDPGRQQRRPWPPVSAACRPSSSSFGDQANAAISQSVSTMNADAAQLAQLNGQIVVATAPAASRRTTPDGPA